MNTWSSTPNTEVEAQHSIFSYLGKPDDVGKFFWRSWSYYNIKHIRHEHMVQHTEHQSWGTTLVFSYLDKLRTHHRAYCI
jgi:hypothetical protein